jgi:chemotaxis family two-component system sensor kinase Cph1
VPGLPMQDDPVAFGAADLTNCDREQIHIPGSIQPHGALLAAEPGTFRIVQAGGALKSLLGVTAPELLGKDLSACFSPARIAHLSSLAASPAHLARALRAFEIDAADKKRKADVIVHISDDLLVIELEPQQENEPQDSLTLVQTMMNSVLQTQSIADLYQAIVDGVRTACAFDRVMLYRFLADGTGAVEAEARGADIEPYLGLRYPASDIPQQARALYLHNWIRLIPDARYTPAALYAESGAAIDLSQSTLRSVSPIHLEYLANMGVVASMSLSIIIDGKLWGLIACHHGTPRFLPHRLRVAFELFAQMASFQIETRLEAEDLGSRLRGKTINDALVASLTGETELAEGLKRFQANLLEYIPAGGMALWLDGEFSGFGKTPKEQAVRGIIKWLNETLTDGLFYTDHLSSHYSPAMAFADVASGMLALSISRSPRDYIIWFRPEIVQTVTWAGNPAKPVHSADPGERISPRKSFAAWQQDVRMRSDPWSGVDIKTAQSLRVSLLEIVLEHIDQLARERQRARVQQDALLAELDHRIVEWEKIAQQLKLEGDRRAVVEAELSQVLRRTVVEQEAERQRIARELHDSLGQYLTVMRLDLDAIAHHDDASGPIRQRVEKLKSLTTDLGQEVNHLAWEIRPTVLDDLGLQTAFEQFLEEWSERSTLKFDLHLTLSDRRLPPAMETALYRVLQEAVRNVVKHAGATRIGVILEATAAEVRLIIEDDGKGFVLNEGEGAPSPSARLGLLGVRERLALVGGSLEIETAPGSGTTLLIHVPL